LAHHEPVLHKRFADTIKAIEFVIQHLETATPNSMTPLAKLLTFDLIDLKNKAESFHAYLDTFRV
jgi:hypothetical protein